MNRNLISLISCKSCTDKALVTRLIANELKVKRRLAKMIRRIQDDIGLSSSDLAKKFNQLHGVSENDFAAFAVGFSSPLCPLFADLLKCCVSSEVRVEALILVNQMGIEIQEARRAIEEGYVMLKRVNFDAIGVSMGFCKAA